MSTETAGLSMREAFEAAEAEADVTAPASEEPVSSPAEEPEASHEEQSAVENEEPTGLFGELREETPEEEQPGLEDSSLVEVDGEQISLADLKAGYMMKADYTRKTQELSEQRKEAETAIALYKSLEQNPQATMRLLNERIVTGQGIGIEAPATQEPQSPDIDALVEKKLEERLASDPRLRAIEEQKAMDQINAQFAALEEAYEVEISDADRIQVLQKAQQAGTGDIGLVFGAMMQQRELLQKQRANANANSSSSGYGGQQVVGSVPKPKPEKFGSFRDAMNDTFAEEGVTAEQLQAAVANL